MKKKNVTWKGHKLLILPDLSRRTLRMCSLMFPLFSTIQYSNATYRWQFPFHLIIKKDNSTFLLHSPRELPRLCESLHCAPFKLPHLALTRCPPQQQAPRGRRRPPQAPGSPPSDEAHHGNPSRPRQNAAVNILTPELPLKNHAPLPGTFPFYFA